MNTEEMLERAVQAALPGLDGLGGACHVLGEDDPPVLRLRAAYDLPAGVLPALHTLGVDAAAPGAIAQAARSGELVEAPGWWAAAGAPAPQPAQDALRVLCQPFARGVLSVALPGRRILPDRYIRKTLAALAAQVGLLLEACQAHAALAASQHHLAARHDATLAALVDGLASLDAGGRLTAVSPGLASCLGYEPGEGEAGPGLLGRPLHEVLMIQPSLPADGRPGSLQPAGDEAAPAGDRLSGALDQVLRTRGLLKLEGCVLLRRDGQPLHADVVVWPAAEGGASLAVRDVTPYARLAGEVERLRPLAALGQGLAVVAHEVRNPLATLSTGLEYLAMRLRHDEECSQAVSSIQEQARRVGRLLDEFLLFARPPQLSPTPVQLPTILAGVVAGCAARAQARDVRLINHCPATLPHVVADGILLGRAIANIVENALDFTPAGGEVALRARLVQQPGAWIVLDIADTGPGIEPRVQARLFEPFFTTRSKGTGLGLANARQIVQQHGGRITLQSYLGVGTIFSVWLPAVN